MRKIIILLLVVFASFGRSIGQLVEFSLIERYSMDRIDSLINDFDPAASLFFTPVNAVDLYRVVYKTPYKHIDSLVNVTGAIAVPQSTICPVPMAAYFHGTVSKGENVPSYVSREGILGVIFSSLGYLIPMPDYLGLGDSDPQVIIHPYIHAFSQAHTSLNMLRTARQLSDSLSLELNGQLFLTGYSQGGFTTMATHKLIEEEYADEFTVTASSPMSGPYDLKRAQVDLIAADSAYATPGYLPYIILAYQSIFGNLYDSIEQVLVPPYDTLLPPLFYGKNTGMGQINGQCEPVPKDMIVDSVVQQFFADSLHPLRLNLAESHLLDWAPNAPVQLQYCKGDDQVTYLNSERAYDAWLSNGATQVEKQDLGDFDHFSCVQFALLATKAYIESFTTLCTGIEENSRGARIKIYPNPAGDYTIVEIPGQVGAEDPEILIFDIAGRLIKRSFESKSPFHIATDSWQPGMYILQFKQGDIVLRAKLLVR